MAKNMWILRQLAIVVLVSGMVASCGDGHETTGEQVPAEFVTADDAPRVVRNLYFSKHFPLAVDVGNTLLEQYPDNTELAAWHVLALARDRNHEAAKQRVLILEAEHPADPWTLFAKAAATAWTREWPPEEGLEASAAALAANPSHPDFVWVRAESLRMKGQKAEGIVLLEQHQELLERHVELQNLLAATMFDLALEDPSDDSKRSAALDAFDKSREIDPGNVNAHFQPGWFLMAVDRPAEAYPLLKSAAELSDAPFILGYYWGSILKHHDLEQSEKQAIIDESISRALDASEVSPDLLVRAAGIYGELGLRDKQFAVGERVLEADPDSKYAEQIRHSRVFAMLRDPDPDESELREALSEVIAREPHGNPFLQHQAMRLLFERIKGDPETSDEELYALIERMSETEGRTRFVAYTEGVNVLADRKAYLEDAEQLASEGLEFVAQVGQSATRPTPGAPPMSSRPGGALKMEAAVRDALGWVFFQKGDNGKAEQELLTAYALDNTAPSTLLHLGQFHEAAGNRSEAQTYYIKCAGLPMREDHPCANVLLEFYKRQHGTEEGFDNYLASIREEILAASALRVAERQVREAVKPLPFSLRSLDGNQVVLEDLIGKTVIVKFWAVWCAPCRVEMPEYDVFYERFSGDEDLALVTISLDPNPDAVRRYLSENDFGFDVLIDDQYARAANVVGIPTTWFVDPQGNMVFDLRGVTHDLENEYVARLDQIRGEAYTKPESTTQ